MLKEAGYSNFYIDAGGDIQVEGNKNGEPWRIGIRNPFERKEIVKVLSVTDKGIATSGTAIRGQHIYDPHNPDTVLQDIVSLTVIGPDVYEADRFATAAFAMGKRGIYYIEQLLGFEGYMIAMQKLWQDRLAGILRFPKTPGKNWSSLLEVLASHRSGAC